MTRSRIEVELLNSCIDDIEDLINTEVLLDEQGYVNRLKLVLIKLRAVKELINF